MTVQTIITPKTVTKHIICSSFLHQQRDSQITLSKNTGKSQHCVQCALKNFEETGEMEDQRRSGRPTKLFRADEQYLKEIFSLSWIWAARLWWFSFLS